MNEQQTIDAALRILESRLQQPGSVIRGSEEAASYLKLRLAERKAEVFGALLLNARNAVIEYRDPGSAEPSAADVRLTKRLTEVLEPIDTRVLDRIVISGTRTTSLQRERHDLKRQT